jgi:hypothetical protein
MAEAKQSSSRNIKVSKEAVEEAFKALSNWGRWGKDDQIGTLNHATPADVVAAAKLIKRGKSFALGIPLGQSGPQRGLFGKRWNPIHTMLATGTDALAGRQQRLLYADDALNMPIQSATHWDSLGHVFFHDKMYNGHHASNVDCNGLASWASSTPGTRSSAAACCSTSPASRASRRCRTATASPTTSSTPARRPRRSRSARATS